MPCRVCVELEEALLSAREPSPHAHLMGLNAAGMRNHVYQKQEHLLRSELNLEKHRKWCESVLQSRQSGQLGGGPA